VLKVRRVMWHDGVMEVRWRAVRHWRRAISKDLSAIVWTVGVVGSLMCFKSVSDQKDTVT